MNTNPLAPARGVVNGVILGSIIWGLLGFVWAALANAEANFARQDTINQETNLGSSYRAASAEAGR
ncbi:hypothetical protein U0C82_03930 [Fulvimarina sp. 2208YS6-2-32]|uniref:Uncharacterized protein n=1 Tax=Fulvimarina uroteuthidis TaxID=3098149 RepID=A0ABU5HYV4_9HYPH|nr:hypothetical protein [Fulvimarina sp. 2208YS6-2-32]MDY8108299.1 hypothetical protein [Fulvimarina sp. 2208YS6-2-32]